MFGDVYAAMACPRCGYGSWGPREVDAMGLDEVAWLLGVGQESADPVDVLVLRDRYRRERGREPTAEEIEAELGVRW